ncbi:MAG: DUF433 domain-containing protein [Leptospira sp.]|nr:DUF433 domain-containing protein [Leptospira sp.]
MEQFITISPDVQSGTPVFFNTRVPIKNFFDYLSDGFTIDDFLDDFPSVTREQTLKILDLVCSMVTFQYSGNMNEKSAA